MSCVEFSTIQQMRCLDSSIVIVGRWIVILVRKCCSMWPGCRRQKRGQGASPHVSPGTIFNTSISIILSTSTHQHALISKHGMIFLSQYASHSGIILSIYRHASMPQISSWEKCSCKDKAITILNGLRTHPARATQPQPTAWTIKQPLNHTQTSVLTDSPRRVI